MGRDYKARRTWTEEQLAADALRVRRAHGYLDNTWSFDVLRCLERLEFTRNIPVEMFDLVAGGDPAYVDFKRRKLCLSSEVLNRALDNDGWARCVIAHEIAHLRLHCDGVNAFSPLSEAQEHWIIKEQRVEWQAQTWSGYFLAPDVIVSSLGSVDALVEEAHLDAELATFRLAQVREKELRRALAEACQDCGEWSAMKLTQGFWCSNCRKLTPEANA